MSNVQDTLAERGSRYGDFSDHAAIAQDIQTVMQTSVTKDPEGRYINAWACLNPVQKQALTVIADKIARILSGDPNYADNWHDIQGYARLVEERLPGSQIGKTTVVAALWKRWDGAYELPKGLGSAQTVEVRLRCGDLTTGIAGGFSWGYLKDSESPADIIAWRLAP